MDARISQAEDDFLEYGQGAAGYAKRFGASYAGSFDGTLWGNTIRAWLGHVLVNTTNVYAEEGLEMKAKTLATCEVRGAVPP